MSEEVGYSEGFDPLAQRMDSITAAAVELGVDSDGVREIVLDAMRSVASTLKPSVRKPAPVTHLGKPL